MDEYFLSKKEKDNFSLSKATLLFSVSLNYFSCIPLKVTHASLIGVRNGDKLSLSAVERTKCYSPLVFLPPSYAKPLRVISIYLVATNSINIYALHDALAKLVFYPHTPHFPSALRVLVAWSINYVDNALLKMHVIPLGPKGSAGY